MAMSSVKPASITPPLRLETIKAYAEGIFAPIRRGESVATVWVPMLGRRVRNKFIISYPQLFEKEIGNSGKYLLVYVEPLELTEESNSGYLNLLIRSIIESYNKQQGNGNSLEPKEFLLDSTSYPQLLESLERLLHVITGQDIEVVLFLGEFDELTFANQVFYNNLKIIWLKAQGKLHFVFLLLEDVTKPEIFKKYGELNEILLKNVVYVPLVSNEDALWLIEYFGEQLKRKFSKEEKALLGDVCGGHPLLIKACTRLIALMNGQKLEDKELVKFLIFHFDPRSACQEIFDSLDPSEQYILKTVVGSSKTDLPAESNTLQKLGLVIKDKGGIWRPFGKLLASVIEKGRQGAIASHEENKQVVFDEQTGAIFVGGRNVEEQFARQEYEILKFFLKNPSRLRSREEVGEAMWGKESYDKYSDWAIDKVMSKIRKKLKEAGAEELVATVRGRGYKLTMVS